MKSKLLLLTLVILLAAKQNAEAQFCTGTTNLTAASGTFSDGSGTGNYNDNTNCSWLIQPAGASSITINFTAIDVEACCDSVNIYDGINASAPLLGTYSGSSLPAAVTSSNGSVFVHFTSNSTNTAAGWDISYTSCNLNIIAVSTPGSICVGGTAQLNAFSLVYAENFDTTISPQLTVVGGVAASTCGSVSGNALYFDGATTRTATTTALNVSSGGTIDFYLEIADATAPCETADAAEEVVLEYSIDTGATWVLMNTYLTGGIYANFTAISVLIPIGAQTSSTQFRWRQLSNSGVGFDNWSLDNISVSSSPATFSYSWTPATGLSAANIANPTSTVNTSTTYTVLVTDGGCSETASITVNVTAATPAVITANDTTAFCLGDSVGLIANTGVSYLWSNGDTTQSIVANTTGNYSVTINYGFGCVATSTPTVVTVNALPIAATIAAAGSTTLCNSSVVLNASAGANLTYQWYKNGLEIVGATAASYTASNGGNFTIVVTNVNGCNATSLPLTVDDQTPAINIIAAPSSVCAGGTTQLNILSGSLTENFDPIIASQWTILGGVEANTCGSVTGNALYFDAAGVRSATTYNLNVASGGTIDFSLEISNATAPCEAADAGEEVVLEYSIDNGVTWSLINTFVTGATYASFTPVSTVIPAAAQTNSTQFRWRQLSNSGATYDNWSLDDINISSASGLYSYSWSPSIGLSSTTIANPTATISNTSTYTVLVSSPSCSATGTVTVNVVSPTPAIITASDSTVFCQGDNTTLTATLGISYLWSTGDTTQSITTAQAGNYSVYVDYGFACTDTSGVTTIVVNPLPTVPTVTPSGTPSLCSGSTITLSSSTGSNLVYQWNKYGANIVGASSNSYTATNGGDYSVVVTDNNNCSSESLPLTVTDLTPIINVTATPAVICSGGSVQLNVSSTILTENFDIIDTTLWVISNGVSSVACGSVSGNALYFDGTGLRSATTNNMNVSGGGTVDFYLQISNTTSPCEAADAGEEVVLEYSIDNGVTWVIINTYAVGGVYANFTAISEMIPAAAQTSATKFRWRQISNSGALTDNWSLDEIEITGSNTSYTYNWIPGTGLSATNISNPMAVVGSSGTYTVQVTNSGVCSTTGSVTVVATNAINIGSTQNNANCVGCCNGTASVTVIGGVLPYTYSWSPAPQGGQGTPNATGLCAGTYVLTVTDSIGCSTTYSMIITDPTGINENSLLSNISLYPNPSNGKFTLTKTTLKSEKLMVSIVNVIGEQIFFDELPANVNHREYNIETISAGIYFVRIQDLSGHSKLIKLMKN